MGTEKCPFCGQEIDTAATKCFFCGAELNEVSIHKRLEQLHMQDLQTTRRVRDHFLVKVIVIIILACVVFFYGTSDKKHISDVGISARPSTVILSAKVTFSGEQFVVSNIDSFDWKNVKLEIIPESVGETFRLSVQFILSGETYTADAVKFINNDGVRFDSDKMKPRKFRILCDTPAGESGSYQTDCK